MIISSVKTKNFEMEYMTFGSGKRIFVILPGLSLKSVLSSASAIEDAYKIFADSYTVYLFDRKKDVQSGYTVEDMADDTACAMKELGISGAYVFGASQGGMIAQYIAIKYPELVRCLVLGSTASRVNKTMQDAVSTWVDYAKSGDYRALNRDCFIRMYSEEFRTMCKDMLSAAENDGTKEDCKRFTVLAQSADMLNTYDLLDKIKCKTLVIGAKDDKVVSCDASYEIAEKLNCDIYMYDKYGHAVYDEAPDYRQRILEFFDKN